MGEKQNISASVEEELIDYADELVEGGYFASRTHVIEVALRKMKDQSQEETLL